MESKIKHKKVVIKGNPLYILYRLSQKSYKR